MDGPTDTTIDEALAGVEDAVRELTEAISLLARRDDGLRERAS